MGLYVFIVMLIASLWDRYNCLIKADGPQDHKMHY